jgi:putative DNA methylase
MLAGSLRARGPLTRNGKRESRPKAKRASPHLSIWSAARGRTPTGPSVLMQSATGATYLPNCHTVSMTGCYSRVEKASGEVVTLKEYLEQVWAAVAKEALSLVFEGADTAGFEPDARLTAMWLWILNAGANAEAGSADEADRDAADDEDSGGKTKPKGGFTLEYDAARKIAQGLGAHLEELSHLVEIKGDQARLLPVSERTKHLFGKEEAQAPTRARGKKNPVQGDLFADLREAERETGWGVAGAPKAGETVLDRIHQSMILFAAGRGEALKRFLVEEGAGRDQRFWSLAQALSALYPNSTDEKRWVDGVLARKKSIGF